MGPLMPLTLAHIYRYPVKGLSPEPLEQIPLSPGEMLPNDRRFAIAHGTTRFDPAAPEWMEKTNFLMLMRNERLARLKSRFDDATGMLTLRRDDRVVARANILEPTGRTVIEQFFAAYMGSEVRGAPRLLTAPGHSFSDTARKVVSLIGLASISDLERVTRVPVDHRRFRANLYFTDGRAWQEFDWMGKELAIGAVRLRVVDRIQRCAATNVDPTTGVRDLNIPLALQEGFRHGDLGVYAEVTKGGKIAIGEEISAPA